MDLFSWSIPFLCEKVTEMLYHLSKRKKDTPTEKPVKEEGKVPIGVPKKAEILRNKVKSISRMMKLFKVLRQENEDILKLKGLCPDNKLPRGVLLEGSTAIKDALQQFGDTKKADIANEKYPDLPHT